MGDVHARAFSTVREAIALLRRSETSGLLIVDGDGAVVGFLSDGDIVKHLARQTALVPAGTNVFRLTEDSDFVERFDLLVDVRAIDVATRDVLAIDAAADPEEAFRLLADRRIKKLPVVHKGRLVGCLSRRNIIAVLDDLAFQ